MKNAYNHRPRLVQYARPEGIRAAARTFQTTPPTVRKWLRRYPQQGPSGLQEHSRASPCCPHQTPSEIQQRAVRLRPQRPTFGAARLQREFDLPLSHIAIQQYTAREVRSGVLFWSLSRGGLFRLQATA